MKYSIQVNQLGIVTAGLHDTTDLTDWALLEYVFDWQTNTRAARIGDHVWLNYQHLIAEMPMLGLRIKSAVSNRVKKLVGLGLLSITHGEDNRVFAKTTDFYIDVVKFRPGDSLACGVHENEQVFMEMNGGVHTYEQGVHENEHSINNQIINNQETRERLNAGAREVEKPTVGEIAAAEVCVMWMSLGVVQCNPSHPNLLVLISDGATKVDFEAAGREAVSRGKGFGYALAIVRGLLADRSRQAVSGGINENFGGNDARNRKSGGNSRFEHSRRLGDHLDKLIEAEFGSGMDIGFV